MSETAKHKGQFTKNDPRIFKGGRQRVEVIRGMTIAEIAQTKSPQCVDLLHAVVCGVDEDSPNKKKDYPINQRIRAAELILAYAFGKPVNSLQLTEINKVSGSGSLTEMHTSELLALAQSGAVETQEAAEG